MPGQGKYTRYVPVKSEHAIKGKASTAKLSKLFNPPSYLTDENELIKLANKHLLAEDTGGIQQGDPMMFPDGVNLNYGEAPDLLTAKIGGGGLPSTPFSPNQSSPGEENGLSPVGQQDLEIKSVKEINQSAEMGVNGLVNPAKSSQLGKVTVLATDRNVLVQGARPGGEAPKSNS